MAIRFAFLTGVTKFGKVSVFSDLNNLIDISMDERYDTICGITEIVGDAELYFQNAFYIVTKLLGFYVDVERTISDGRIDMIAKTKDYIYIFEFKYDKSADVVLQQIEDKGYAKPFAADSRKLFKIGVNFSREHRCIDDWKIAE